MGGLSLSKKWHLKANIIKIVYSFSNTAKNQDLLKELLIAS